MIATASFEETGPHISVRPTVKTKAATRPLTPIDLCFPRFYLVVPSLFTSPDAPLEQRFTVHRLEAVAPWVWNAWLHRIVAQEHLASFFEAVLAQGFEEWNLEARYWAINYLAEYGVTLLGRYLFESAEAAQASIEAMKAKKAEARDGEE